MVRHFACNRAESCIYDLCDENFHAHNVKMPTLKVNFKSKAYIHIKHNFTIISSYVHRKKCKEYNPQSSYYHDINTQIKEWFIQNHQNKFLLKLHMCKLYLTYLGVVIKSCHKETPSLLTKLETLQKFILLLPPEKQFLSLAFC